VVLSRGIAEIERVLNKLKVKYMTPEERKKWELIEEQKQRYKEEQAKKQEYMKLMKKQQEEDRKMKAEQVVRASVANELHFGANIVKFKPPCPPKGG
jgi:DNA replication protein DnaC